MLTATQYELIGRVTLGLNDIELVIAFYMGDFLCPQEVELSLMISRQRQSFNQRKARFQALLCALEKQYPDIKNEIEAVSSLVSNAEALSNKRNSLAHGIPMQTQAGWELQHIERRGEPFACDEVLLSQLADEVTKAADDLVNTCGALGKVLKAKRDR